MTTTDWARIDPTDPRFHLEQNLRDVRSGVKSRAAGIVHCPDCAEPWINDHTGLTTCPGCRINHRRRCRDCRAFITNTTDGNPLCDSCTNQISLF